MKRTEFRNTLVVLEFLFIGKLFQLQRNIVQHHITCLYFYDHRLWVSSFFIATFTLRWPSSIFKWNSSRLHLLCKYLTFNTLRSTLLYCHLQLFYSWIKNTIILNEKFEITQTWINFPIRYKRFLFLDF